MPLITPPPLQIIRGQISLNGTSPTIFRGLDGCTVGWDGGNSRYVITFPSFVTTSWVLSALANRSGTNQAIILNADDAGGPNIRNLYCSVATGTTSVSIASCLVNITLVQP